MLDDKLNIKILEYICSGEGVSINISLLSKKLKKHRNTIKTHAEALFQNNIIVKPYYPLRELFNRSIEQFISNSNKEFVKWRSW